MKWFHVSVCLHVHISIILYKRQNNTWDFYTIPTHMVLNVLFYDWKIVHFMYYATQR